MTYQQSSLCLCCSSHFVSKLKFFLDPSRRAYGFYILLVNAIISCLYPSSLWVTFAGYKILGSHFCPRVDLNHIILISSNLNYSCQTVWWQYNFSIYIFIYVVYYFNMSLKIYFLKLSSVYSFSCVVSPLLWFHHSGLTLSIYYSFWSSLVIFNMCHYLLNP